MSSVVNSHDAAVCGQTTVIDRPGNNVAGLRVLTQPFSTFVVHAFPFASIAEIVRLDALQRPGSYLCYDRQSARAYVGESGKVAKRLPDHLKDSRKQYATEVFVVTSTDDCYQKPQAVFSQKYYYDAAEAAGLVTLTNEVRPQSANLQRREVGRLVRELSSLFLPLFDGGCRAFHDFGAPKPAISNVVRLDRPAPERFETDEDDCGLILIGPTTVPLGVEECELKYMDLWARGYWYEGRFIVAAGSEVRNATNVLIPGIVKKRKSLEARGVLGPIPGVTDRKRLLVPIVLRTDANAAKVCSGAHIDSGSWHPLARNLPLVIDL